MISLNNLVGTTNIDVRDTAKTNSSAATSETPNKTASSVPSNESATKDKSSVSSLARQLSDAAARAEARDASHSRSELASYAQSVIEELAGISYINSHKTHAEELPATDDPELLARAKQANDFANGRGTNPFKGLSRDQLALITYDDSNTFTVNERRAALHESNEQESAWSHWVVAKSKQEWNQGEFKQTEFFKLVLKHYEDLPRIEQVQAPANYESRLNHLIAMDYNFVTGESGKNANPLNSLFDLLLPRNIEQGALQRPESD
ncbi:hypothetical protein F6Q07_19290 [Pectobacterium parmentieri]|uniref:hypothetical protein n=1 Tax=Pectobacterium parmentieri TaxID=1905730 RepID=UPI000EAD24B1|nr:hypothetical protein [Pectobacterium parmentieri]AYH03053.1 hypothetical protein C5E26_20020 [Pectobacterium parmentieri]AYH29312.1 hypothetical protein C5E20_20375 [Pectobacterium parmentieri]AYH33730.1 hypothetical protein C5E19_20005 [Pectobacterium parmentieri]MBI0520249.1 hypothetical protein [Pectobacterium parmentieri]